MENNKILSREDLEQLPTQQLDEMLHAELRREPADGEAVRAILSVLKQREAARPAEIMPESRAAWDAYRKRGRRGFVLKAASLAAALLVLFAAIPQQVEAESFFGRLARWTDSIFELFAPGEDTESDEYIFETDHPGLQQVYDTLAELGVTEPVVPTWLPEGFELTECKAQDTSRKTKMIAVFKNGENFILFKFDVYKEIANVEYQKDETAVEEIEMSGVTHQLLQNNKKWVGIWTRDNIECSISVDCQKDTLVDILRSIYTTED